MFKSARRRRRQRLVESVVDGVSWHWTRQMHVAVQLSGLSLQAFHDIAAVRWPVESLGVQLVATCPAIKVAGHLKSTEKGRN